MPGIDEQLVEVEAGADVGDLGPPAVGSPDRPERTAAAEHDVLAGGRGVVDGGFRGAGVQGPERQGVGQVVRTAMHDDADGKPEGPGDHTGHPLGAFDGAEGPGGAAGGPVGAVGGHMQTDTRGGGGARGWSREQGESRAHGHRGGTGRQAERQGRTAVHGQAGQGQAGRYRCPAHDGSPWLVPDTTPFIRAMRGAPTPTAATGRGTYGYIGWLSTAGDDTGRGRTGRRGHGGARSATVAPAPGQPRNGPVTS